jgi:hypothetical protein
MSRAFQLGLVVQLIDDAGPAGLTVTELAAKSKLSPEDLIEVLALAIGSGHVKRVEKYVSI